MRNETIIIPSLNPDHRLLYLIELLKEYGFYRIIIVNDGSPEEYHDIFKTAGELGCTIIEHDTNLGKGAAIRTGIKTHVKMYGSSYGVITMDADGQHLPSDTAKISNAMAMYPDSLVLGTRDFGEKNVPFKSRNGNRITSFFFYLSTGIKCPDTQTGLRGIPSSLLQLAAEEEGSRYEYEMRFLEDAVKIAPVRYIPIETLTKLEDKQIENFLTKRGITYKSWKQEIKDKFIRLCCNTKDRIISILKEKFEKLPENAKKIFGMVQSISEDCEKAGETAIGVFAFTFAISIIREIADIGKEYIGAISEACKELFSKHKQEHTSNLKSLDSLKKNISKKDIIAKGLSSWLTMLSYDAATLIRLVSSIKTCCEITQTAKQTENFEKEYNKIKKEFETTKKEVDEILSNTSCDPLYNLEKLNICTEKLCVYKQKITYLIFQIKTKLEENEQKRNKEIFNSIISGIETGVGVLGAWVCKGKPKILYTLGAVINGGNTILNGVNIGLSQKNINKLEELLEKSNQLEKDIDQKIEEIKKIFEDTNDQKAFPSF
mgnify:CR=1 FL=1